MLMNSWIWIRSEQHFEVFFNEICAYFQKSYAADVWKQSTQSLHKSGLTDFSCHGAILEVPKVDAEHDGDDLHD